MRGSKPYIATLSFQYSKGSHHRVKTLMKFYMRFLMKEEGDCFLIHNNDGVGGRSFPSIRTALSVYGTPPLRIF